MGPKNSRAENDTHKTHGNTYDTKIKWSTKHHLRKENKYKRPVGVHSLPGRRPARCRVCWPTFSTAQNRSSEQKRLNVVQKAEKKCTETKEWRHQKARKLAPSSAAAPTWEGRPGLEGVRARCCAFQNYPSPSIVLLQYIKFDDYFEPIRLSDGANDIGCSSYRSG